MVLPWLPLWDRNGFAAMLPFLGDLLASPYARGAVSGVGAVTAIAGVLELAAAFGARRPNEPRAGT